MTLVAKEIAEPGRTFDYLGPDPLCDGCKVRNICFNLEKGARYRIVQVRDTFHDCQATEARVRVAEVERVNRTISVDSAGAIDGTTVSMTLPRCHNVGCANYRICHPHGIDSGDKVVIESAEGRMDCPVGKNRTRVIIK